MIQKLGAIGTKTLTEIEAAQSTEAIEQIRVSVLGKKGALSEVLRDLGKVDPTDRPKIGAVANEWKSKIEAALLAQKEKFSDQELQIQLAAEKIDVTRPPRMLPMGKLHPITQTTRKIVEIFSRLGFDVTLGPEAETEYLCFDSINIPKSHPARDMQDTFFLGPGVVLRTHTSPVQMRTMMSRPWPIRILCPGAVYRCDNDATHSPMFHQIEGLWVDRDVKMSDLKGVLEFFAKELFGSGTKIRLRPSFFPFVEPGAEVDLSCFQCGSTPKSTCRICKGTGWMEVMGAGMVHPYLFKEAGYDPNEVRGFAFGMGIDRITMLLYKLPELRLLFQNDPRFLSQL
jgi:phenylalanyl-tRNA synthetase alpha chain